MKSLFLIASFLTLSALSGCQPAEEPSTSATPPASEPAQPFNPITDPLSDPPSGMVWIPGGTFMMGSEQGHHDEQPVHEVSVDGFWMDTTEVTNRQFAEFVEATGYVTVAERKPRPEDFPGVPEEYLVPGAAVFTPPDHPVSLQSELAWWNYLPGADWRHPLGPESTIDGLQDHPVMHVAWEDAMAYAQWAGKTLPTEAQWEYAARAGHEGWTYVWGNEFQPDGKLLANTWQGHFPNENSEEDGFYWTAPVASFPPNDFGLYDMAGNVWEWCLDWYQPNYYQYSPAINPPGPPQSFDPDEPGVPKRSMRGGSFLCSDMYCARYRPSARMKSSPDTGLSHSGFRCVINSPRAETQSGD